MGYTGGKVELVSVYAAQIPCKLGWLDWFDVVCLYSTTFN